MDEKNNQREENINSASVEEAISSLEKKQKATNKLLIIFGAIGAIFVVTTIVLLCVLLGSGENPADDNNPSGDNENNGDHVHTPAVAVVENKIPATCTTDGSYDLVVYCAGCGVKITWTSHTESALGHDKVHHDAKPATCTEAGWNAYNTCTRCDYTTRQNTPAGHTYVNRVCSSCGDVNYSEGLAFRSNGDGTCFVSRIGTCTDSVIVIPPTSPGGDRVTSIGDHAFEWCIGLTSITIPDGVTSIGSYAFYGCTGLTSITIPDGVTGIGYGAFLYCIALTSITVDANNPNYKSMDGNLYTKDGKTLIGYAIGKDDTHFTIPDSVTSIGDYAFYGCTRLTSITIPDSVTSIGDGAFYGCESLTTVYYKGSEADWGEISIGDRNGNLTNANITFNYEG